MEDAEKLLDYLCQRQELLAEDETIENEVEMPDTGAMGLTLADGSYYVNVRTSSIVIAAAISFLFMKSYVRKMFFKEIMLHKFTIMFGKVNYSMPREYEC